jgi:hypothetical protein
MKYVIQFESSSPLPTRVPDARALRETGTNHRVFRRDRLLAVIVSVVVGVAGPVSPLVSEL